MDSGERLEVDVELGAQGAIGVVVAPLTPCRGTDLDRTPHQLLAEFDELRNSLLEAQELLHIGGAELLLPIRHDVGEFLVALEQLVAISLDLDPLRRHVDAAQFHHDRVDQAIDALDVDRGHRRRRKVLAECALQPNGLHRHDQQEGGQEHQQRYDRVQFLADAEITDFARIMLQGWLRDHVEQSLGWKPGARRHAHIAGMLHAEGEPSALPLA